MVEAATIAQWKKEHGKIYALRHRDVDYFFRALTFTEYDEIEEYEKNTSTPEAEELLVETVLLHPNYNAVPSGVITSVAEMTIKVSVFSDPQAIRSMLNFHREEYSKLRGLMKAFVLSTMPAYTEEDIDAWNLEKMCAKIALAEQIIKVNQAAFGVEADFMLNVVDPEEEVQARIQYEEKKRKERERAEKLIRDRGGLVPESDESGPIMKPKLDPNDPILRKLQETL